MVECIAREVIRNYRLSEKVPTLLVRCDIMLFIADSDHNALGHDVYNKGYRCIGITVGYLILLCLHATIRYEVDFKCRASTPLPRISQLSNS